MTRYGESSKCRITLLLMERNGRCLQYLGVRLGGSDMPHRSDTGSTHQGRGLWDDIDLSGVLILLILVKLVTLAGTEYGKGG